MVVQSKSGLMVAAGMPRGVIDKISRDTTRVAQDDLRQRFVDVGAVAIGNLLGQFSAALKVPGSVWRGPVPLGTMEKSTEIPQPSRFLIRQR